MIVNIHKCDSGIGGGAGITFPHIVAGSTDTMDGATSPTTGIIVGEPAMLAKKTMV